MPFQKGHKINQNRKRDGFGQFVKEGENEPKTAPKTSRIKAQGKSQLEIMEEVQLKLLKSSDEKSVYKAAQLAEKITRLREMEGRKDQPIVDPAVRNIVEAAMRAEQETGVSGRLYFEAMNDLATDGLDQDVKDRMIEKAKENVSVK